MGSSKMTCASRVEELVLVLLEGRRSGVPRSEKRTELGRSWRGDHDAKKMDRERAEDRLQLGLLLPRLEGLFLLLPANVEQGVAQGFSGEVGGGARVK
jgi:hypothetical protein